MDEIGIWSRALSAQEVAGLYNSGSGVQYPFMGTTTISTSFLVYDANPSADTSNLLTYNSLPSVATTTSLSSVSYPFASSTATSTINTLTVSTTTPYTVYSPFSNYVEDTRGTITTYLTLNGQLIGTYSYQQGQESTTGKITYVLTNYLGTPVLETDDKGDIVEMDVTDVFGNYVYRDQRNDNAYHNKGYTGHEYDDVTGLTYAHARYLDTKTHSFLSVDQMSYSLPQAYLYDPQQMNSYAYARNNPIVYSDPTGLYSWDQFKKDTSSIFNIVINTVTTAFANSTPAITAGINGATQLSQDVGTGSIYNVAGAINYTSGNTCTSCKNVQQQMVNQSTLLSTSGINTNSNVYKNFNFIGGFATPIPGGPLGKAEGMAAKQASKAAEEIIAGHAFVDHIDHFASVGVATKDKAVELIQNIMTNPTLTKQLKNGRMGFYDSVTNFVVIHDPVSGLLGKDFGTAFIPTNRTTGEINALEYFMEKLK